MEKMTLKTEPREKIGKGASRDLRRKKMIPAVLYRAGKSTPLKLSKQELIQFINKTEGKQSMVTLQFANGENKLALLKDYQTDPVKGELLHVDFFEVSLKEKIRVTVYINTVGEPIGVKKDKGILQHLYREIEIECLPDRIPDKVEIDVSNLEIGQSLHVKDVKLGDDIKILTNPDEVIVTVLAPAVEEAAPAEEVVAPEILKPEGEEPEVIKKGKKEEKEEGEEKDKSE